MTLVLQGKIPSGLNTVTGTIPSTVVCTWIGSAQPSQYRGIPVAVFLLGGPQLLLYLFARVSYVYCIHIINFI